jgi:hypothetical protein
MIVRERRRIGALARSASALDERLQAAERAANESETALRSYMDEQSEELVAIKQNQQEHILSLMDMVKEESEREPMGSQHTEDTGDSIMTLLANERILVLEQELRDIRSRSSAQHSYRKIAEDLNLALQSKSQEDRELQEELTELRGTLRQVREVATNHPGDAKQISSIVDIVKAALHPNVANSSSTIQVRRRVKRGRIGDRRDESKQMFSPRIMKHIELMHTSDSELDDGAKAWTTDIMKDLALIADDKVPPSLESSKAFTDQKCQIENGSVFDRLADPQSFTGTQKQAVDAKSDTEPPKKGQQERRVMSREIVNCLEKIVVPDEVIVGNRTPNETDGDSRKVPARKDSGNSNGKSYKSVFERLVSPSNYTGTQKDRLHESRSKLDHDSDEAATRLLDNLLEGDKGMTESSGEKHDSVTNSLHAESNQMNVFERLQRTSTQAYAVKHNGSMLPDFSAYYGASPSRPNKPTFGRREEVKGTQSDYIQQDVFERLQKTTTEAYAKKTKEAREQ